MAASAGAGRAHVHGGSDFAAARVRLLTQAAIDAPTQATLRKLGVALPPEAADTDAVASGVAAQASAIQRSRIELRSILRLAHDLASTSSVASAAALEGTLHDLVTAALAPQASRSERNRVLYLAALAAGDGACANALSRPAVVSDLCALLGGRPGCPLSLSERQWILHTLSEIAARPLTLTTLLRAGAVECLKRVLSSSEDEANSCQEIGTAGRAQSDDPPPPPQAQQQHVPLPSSLDRAAAPPPGSLAVEGQSTEHAAGTEEGGARQADGANEVERCRTVAAVAGLRYAAVACVANLALTADGAAALIGGGMLPVLLQCVSPQRGVVVLPSCKWLFTGRRTVLANACVGGGVARALCNLALASTHALEVVRASTASCRLALLQRDQRVSPNVQYIVSIALRALRTSVSSHPLIDPGRSRAISSDLEESATGALLASAAPNATTPMATTPTAMAPMATAAGATAVRSPASSASADEESRNDSETASLAETDGRNTSRLTVRHDSAVVPMDAEATAAGVARGVSSCGDISSDSASAVATPSVVTTHSSNWTFRGTTRSAAAATDQPVKSCSLPLAPDDAAASRTIVASTSRARHKGGSRGGESRGGGSRGGGSSDGGSRGGGSRSRSSADARPLPRRKRSRTTGPDGGGGAQLVEFDAILAKRYKARRLEYLVKWRSQSVRKHDAAAEWLPHHHIHYPEAVAAYERGSESAQAYSDWAWALDPRGAGWTTVPLETLPESSGACVGPSHRRGPLGQQPVPPTGTDSRLPDGWPEGVTYTPFLLWETRGTAALRLRSAAYAPLACVRIGRLPAAHPARHGRALERKARAVSGANAASPNHDRPPPTEPAGGEESRGLFARCALPIGTWIGDFTGVVKPQMSGDESRYLLEVFCDPSTGIRLDVDAQRYGNETRFINDYKGVAAEPNVAFNVYRVPWTGELAIALVTTSAIRCGSEILADYGTSFWRDNDWKPAEAAGTAAAPRLDAIQATPPTPPPPPPPLAGKPQRPLAGKSQRPSGRRQPPAGAATVPLRPAASASPTPSVASCASSASGAIEGHTHAQTSTSSRPASVPPCHQPRLCVGTRPASAPPPQPHPSPCASPRVDACASAHPLGGVGMPCTQGTETAASLRDTGRCDNVTVSIAVACRSEKAAAASQPDVTSTVEGGIQLASDADEAPTKYDQALSIAADEHVHEPVQQSVHNTLPNGRGSPTSDGGNFVDETKVMLIAPLRPGVYLV